MHLRKKFCKFEDDMGVNNVTYKLVDKRTKEVVKDHPATNDDPIIDLDDDIGNISGDMANVPAEGIRINLQDAVAKSLEQCSNV